MKTPAVFLDRDGTLIEDAGFLRSVAQVDFYPQTFSALRRLGDFALFIVTNQSGIAQGHIRAEEACAVNDYVVRRLGEEGTAIRAVYCCPHQRSDACECMKPKPYFLRIAEREHEIDLARSFVVGDHPSDMELAHAVGARGIYVLTGHGSKHRAELRVPGTVVANIATAADVILDAHAIGILRSNSACAS
jgi:D-glycero-D-manno-heptose 1,7-bisphosphate phosphatase